MYIPKCTILKVRVLYDKVAFYRIEKTMFPCKFAPELEMSLAPKLSELGAQMATDYFQFLYNPVCLFVFYVPSTARSFRDGTPIYCPLRRT